MTKYRPLCLFCFAEVSLTAAAAGVLHIVVAVFADIRLLNEGPRHPVEMTADVVGFDSGKFSHIAPLSFQSKLEVFYHSLPYDSSSLRSCSTALRSMRDTCT